MTKMRDHVDKEISELHDNMLSMTDEMSKLLNIGPKVEANCLRITDNIAIESEKVR
jgi:hypothetical protein